jgi:hypothetical protein
MMGVCFARSGDESFVPTRSFSGRRVADVKEPPPSVVQRQQFVPIVERSRQG